MIRLDYDYIVSADTYGYVLQKDLHKLDKDNKPTYKAIAYTTTLKDAINSLRKRKIRLAHGDNEEISLAEAIERIEKCNKEFEYLLNKAIAEKEDIEIE